MDRGNKFREKSKILVRHRKIKCVLGYFWWPAKRTQFQRASIHIHEGVWGVPSCHMSGWKKKNEMEKYQNILIAIDVLLI